MKLYDYRKDWNHRLVSGTPWQQSAYWGALIGLARLDHHAFLKRRLAHLLSSVYIGLAGFAVLPAWAESSVLQITHLASAPSRLGESGTQIMIVTWRGGTAPFQVQCRSSLVDSWRDVDGITYELSQTNILAGPVGYYRVVSVASTVAAAMDKLAPSSPTDLKATVMSCSQVNLSWSASTDGGPEATGVKGYNLYRNGIFLKQVPAPVTSASDTDLPPVSEFNYTVSAVDLAYNQSPKSNPVTATTPACGECIFAISTSSGSFGAGGGSGSVGVTAGSGCGWAASSGASWITITSGSSGSGSSTLSYAVAANTSTSSRSGTLTIAGQTFTVSQAAASVDNPPVASLLNPGDGTTISGVVACTGNATDDVGVTRVEFWRNGSSLLGTDTTAPYSVSLDTTSLADGLHSFTCKAYDAAGNSTVSQAHAVTVHNAASGGSWVSSFGGTGSDGGRAVAVDGAGNVFAAGWFSGTASFGAASLVSAGGQDVFLTKSTASGSLLWARRFGSTGSETVTSMALDANGNIFLGGYFSGTANLGGNSLASAGNYDMFLAKYDPSGNHLWSQRFGGTDLDALYGLAVDSQGNVVITGSYRQWVSFGGSTFYGIYGGDTGFLAKYSPSGGYLWSQSFAGGSANYGRGVAIGQSDTILITGYFNGWINFGGGQLNAAFASAPNIFIAKFAATGASVWARAHGNQNTIKALAIAVDANADVLITGEFHGQTDLGGGTLLGSAMYTDVFLAKYAGTDGSFRWAQAIVGNLGATPTAIATDGQKNVLVTGYFYGTYNFGGLSLSSLVGQNDVFVGKYSSSGTRVWAERFGGTGTDQGFSLAVDAAGYPVVAGGFSGTASFGTATLTSRGSYDAFVLRLDP